VKQESKFVDGLWYPEVKDSTYALSGEDFELFMTKSVIENQDYKIDLKQNIVQKQMPDGLEPVDFASYALHHMKRHEKHIDKEEMQLVFADLTPEEISTTFIQSFGTGPLGEEKRR
jgi:hypothetical protein